MTDTRPLSGVERLWLAADRFAPPFVNQMVIEGTSQRPADLARWRRAVTRVLPAQPGCKARITGALRRSRWVMDGHAPRIVEVDGALWDGLSPEGAPFLCRPLSPRAGRTAEILLVRDERTPRVVVRTHHAAMDGRGTTLLAEGLFASLRGEDVEPATAGGPTDLDLASDLGGEPGAMPERDCLPPFRGVDGGIQAGLTWLRRRLDGPVRRPLAVLAVAVAQAVGEPCRVDVPVDLRRHRPGLSSSANLTGLLRLPVAPGDDVAAVDADLRRRVEAGEAAGFVLAADRMRGLPMAVIVSGGRAAARDSLSLGRFETSATLSNLGRLDLARLSCPDFAARRVFFVPPGSPGLPLFVTITGDPDGVEVCAAAPVALASAGRLQRLIDDLVTRLGES
jgi:hypothetical protein